MAMMLVSLDVKRYSHESYKGKFFAAISYLPAGSGLEKLFQEVRFERKTEAASRLALIGKLAREIPFWVLANSHQLQTRPHSSLTKR